MPRKCLFANSPK